MQTLRTIEILVVNDASTDGTQDLVERIAADDDRIIVINKTTNGGIYAARATGIARATAPWIGFLDDDDLAHPSMHETMLDYAIQTNADIVMCESRRLDETGKLCGWNPRYGSNHVIDDALFERFCAREFGPSYLWNKLFRAPLIKPHGTMVFDERYDAVEDTIVNLGCFLDARRLAIVAQPLHDYLIHSESVTQSASPMKTVLRLFRGCAKSIELYSDRGEDVRRDIVRLFRHQLSGHPLPDPHFASINTEGLATAARKLAEYYPEGLLTLAATRGEQPRPTSFKKSLADLVRLTSITLRLGLDAMAHPNRR